MCGMSGAWARSRPAVLKRTRSPVTVRLAEIRCGQWVSYVTAIMDVDHGSVAHREPNKPEQSIYNLIDLDYEKVQVRESKYRPNTPT